MSDYELNSIFRVYKNVIRMMKARNYEIDDNSIFQSVQELKAKASIYNIICREKMTLIAQNQTIQPSAQVCVLFIKENGIGIQTIVECEEKVNILRTQLENLKHCIIIANGELTFQAKKRIDQLTQHQGDDQRIFEIFQEEEFLYSMLDHQSIPHYEVLSKEVALELLNVLKIDNFALLPKLHLNDPVARYLKFKRGDVIKIKCRSQTTGWITIYRLCI